MCYTTGMVERRWVIQREEALTFCEDSHPVRLGRSPEHYHGEPTARGWAIALGQKGYLCPGGETHPYPLWIVYDANNDRESNAGVFDVYKDAVALRNKLREEQK